MAIRLAAADAGRILIINASAIPDFSVLPDDDHFRSAADFKLIRDHVIEIFSAWKLHLLISHEPLQFISRVLTVAIESDKPNIAITKLVCDFLKTTSVQFRQRAFSAKKTDDG